MADRSGIGAQLGIAPEVTYGTFVPSTRFIPFTKESIALEIDRIETKGLRSGQRVTRTDGYAVGKKDVNGSLGFEVGNKSFGLLFKNWLGATAQTASGTGFKRTYTIGDLFGDFMSLQIGRPDLAGTIQPFSYSGVKTLAGTLTQERDEFLQFDIDVNGRDEATATALVSAITPTLTELFHWAQMTLTVNAIAVEADSFEFTVENGMNVDRYKLRGTTLKDEPVESDRRKISGKVTTEFNALTDYARFTTPNVQQIVATWTSSLTYDVALPFKIVLTLPNCRFDGATPNVDGADITMIDLPFVVLDGGTPVTLDYFTSDSAD